MELTFSDLRTKEVVNTCDGRKLGKVCDIVLCYPENRWLGIVAPNGRGWNVKKNGLFIDLRQIVTIGEDVILVNVGMPRNQTAPAPAYDPIAKPKPQPRNYDEYE